MSRHDSGGWRGHSKVRRSLGSSGSSDVNLHKLLAMVVDEMNASVELLDVVHDHSCGFATAAVDHRNVIRRAAVAIVQLERWPILGQARAEPQRVDLQSQAEQRLN